MESTGCYSSTTIESVRVINPMTVSQVVEKRLLSQQPSDKVELLVKANLRNLGRSADGKTVVYKTLDLEVH